MDNLDDNEDNLDDNDKQAFSTSFNLDNHKWDYFSPWWQVLLIW